ncbi:CIC11C00000002412 [Sungouiella intermedia]|uniref:CIC11C00000002412 n=1 Tax=Sungouiella intermedia TaxID=45354 RepID=A0A1L0C0Z9_9ASCO|nr:CIC11C00000002412 [[Candida] intermedia]
MCQKRELQSFLPKSSLEADSPIVASSSQPRSSWRTKVRFLTKNKNPTYTNLFSSIDAVYVFEPESTIQQAAKYAASHYPESKSHPVPDFNDVWVFFSDGFRSSRGPFQTLV